jgi:hypothetical protein
MRNHKIFKKYKDALSYANDLIDGIKGEVLFDDAWDDYLVNGENTGDCKIYKNGKFIKTINTDDNYKWSNLIMLYKTDDGFMVYTDFEFDESKKSVRKSIKESKIKTITDYREIKVFLDGHTEPSKKYQTYDFNRYGKKYEINGITENKDDVTLTFERGKLKSFTYLGDTENFDKENNATHFSNAMDKGWICEFDNNNDGSNDDEYTITFRLQLFEFM